MISMGSIPLLWMRGRLGEGVENLTQHVPGDEVQLLDSGSIIHRRLKHVITKGLHVPGVTTGEPHSDHTHLASRLEPLDDVG